MNMNPAMNHLGNYVCDLIRLNQRDALEDVARDLRRELDKIEEHLANEDSKDRESMV